MTKNNTELLGPSGGHVTDDFENVEFVRAAPTSEKLLHFVWVVFCEQCGASAEKIERGPTPEFLEIVCRCSRFTLTRMVEKRLNHLTDRQVAIRLGVGYFTVRRARDANRREGRSLLIG